MQRCSLYFIGLLLCSNALAGAYLPVVDVSGGVVSARAEFGEEIVKPINVSVAPLPKKVAKKVVARNAKKSDTVTVARNTKTSSGDFLKPLRPSADLWANNDSPLRMPRMDEIAVMRSDAILPEESLNVNSVAVAKPEKGKKTEKRDSAISVHESLAELNALRNEIARLNERQKRTEENIAAVRNAVPAVETRTVVESVPRVASVEKNVESKIPEFAPEQREIARNINVRREIVPMEQTKDVVMRSVKKTDDEPRFVSRDNNMTKMSPNELKKAFKKTYLSENKHLSTYQIDDRYDVASDMSVETEGFTAQRDLSEMSSGVRPLEVKISFMNGDSGLSRDNYSLLSETASIVVNNPKRAIQIAIPEVATYTRDARKLAARRLAIVEQVLRDTGVADQRIVPVLSQRDDDVFVLRVISGDVFETLSKQKRNIFGESVSKKTYKSMAW